jgi:hypothetical protein
MGVGVSMFQVDYWIGCEDDEFVGGDSRGGAGIPETRLSGQFFHALRRDFRDVSEDRHQALFSLGYGDSLSCPDRSHGMRGDPMQLGDMLDPGARVGQ